MKRLLNTLYVTNKDAYVCNKDDNACVRVDGEDALRVPLHLLEGIVLFNYAGASAPLLYACAAKGISVSVLDEKGRFAARVEGPVSGNVLLRKAQYEVAADPTRSLVLAKRFMAAKFYNSRAVLLRHKREHPENGDGLSNAIDTFSNGLGVLGSVASREELLGVEGDAAHGYFDSFPSLIRDKEARAEFVGRNRRPPKDPVNASLSFFYTLTSREIATACESVGLDPQMGFYHQPRPGRASLALDVLEEFRAPLIDRFVVALFNRGQLNKTDFEFDAGGGCFFSDAALKRVLDAWQKRKQEEIRHPFLDEKVKIGLLPFVQAQLLSRYLRGDMNDYPAFCWR